jgi:hypothetical protein
MRAAAEDGGGCTPKTKGDIVRIDKRFYVAAPRMRDPNNNWAHPTEKLAIEHATRLLNNDHLCDEQFIVKIIKVVKRKVAPVVVENVT